MKLPGLILFAVTGFLSIPPVGAQQIGVSQKQVDAIKSALQRIAIANNVVENAIHDGMTFEEVLQILNVGRLGIIAEVENGEKGVYTLGHG